MTAILKDIPFFVGFFKKAICFFLLFSYHYISVAQPDLENYVPTNYTATKGTLSISDRHYRLGEQSLRWDWMAGDTLVIDLTPEEEDAVNPYLFLLGMNHFEMWVYNESASKDTFEIKFINTEELDQFRFRFNINYEGWRRLLRSYRHDMLKRYDKFNSSWNVDKIFIVAPLTGSGFVFLDNIQYMRDRELKQSDRTMPDLHSLANDQVRNHSRDFYYQLDILEPPEAIETPTTQQLADINLIRQRIRERGLSTGDEPSAEELNEANNKYEAFNIELNDNLIKGKDISAPESIRDIFVILMRHYIHTNSADSRVKIVNLLRLMFDNGVAGGSARWFAGGSRGYGDRAFFQSLINVEQFADAELRYKIWDWLQWSTDINLAWKEDSDGLFNTDNVSILCDAFFSIILFSPDDEHTMLAVRRYIRYLEKFLTVHKGASDGLKPDGTGFHHETHYNAYMFAFATVITPILSTFQGTSFMINEDAYNNLRKVVYSQIITCNTTSFSNSLSGRHPFVNRTSFSSGALSGLASIGGDILNIPYDPIVAGMQKRIYAPNPAFADTPAEPFPTGFWQMNYSPLAMYRRDNWAATIKGINNYFLGTEIYATANHYGRYQGYGAVEIMYPGGPAASGISAAGWDWNKTPGTTSILFPFDLLNPAKTALEERNQLNFSGGVKFGTPASSAPSDVILADLHGDYGMFAMDFKQGAITATHNPGFVFRKSFFCFGDKIVCLGSNINNDDATHKTITTLFQGALPSSGTPTIINGTTKTGISQSEDLSKTEHHWLIDAYQTGYYVQPGNTIHVERLAQTSPDQYASGATATDNFANAYIDHGYAPAGGNYVYTIAPNTTAQDMAAFAADMQSPATRAFDILQQDSAAHIIRENAGNVTGFSLFLPNDHLVSNDILKSNDVPCVTVMQFKEDTLRISLVNPDLNLVDDQSTAVPITLTLYGNWAKASDIPATYANVLSVEGSTTTIQFNPADGMPAEIALVKNTDVILPLVLLSFSGQSDIPAHQNVLNLSIENDEDTVTYYLERQTSGSTIWNTIADHSFHPETGPQQFTFHDKNIDAAVNLYRVKWQLPHSAAWQYSNVVMLRNDQAAYIIVAPNPATDAFTIRLRQKPPRNLQWFLFDISGKIAKRGLMTNATENIPVQELTPGLYFLRLSTGETIRIVVVR